MYQIKPIVWGNPDYRQDPNKPPYGIKPQAIKSDDLKQLKKKVREWQYENDVGGGNWGSPAVYQDGKILGYMSYNGKIWDKSVWDNKAREVA